MSEAAEELMVFAVDVDGSQVDSSCILVQRKRVMLYLHHRFGHPQITL